MWVINFFGAPGAGKSTAAAGMFHIMKKNWMKVELVTEFAKDLIYDGSSHLLSHQNFVFANQEFRLHRLLDKGVDYAITDSPLLLSSFYAPKDYPESFKQLCFHFFNQYNNINIFINRSHKYSKMGRVHDEDESNKIAIMMKAFLLAHDVPFLEMKASDSTPQKIFEHIKSRVSAVHNNPIQTYSSPVIPRVGD